MDEEFDLGATLPREQALDKTLPKSKLSDTVPSPKNHSPGNRITGIDDTSRIEILERIGQGTQGDVFLAYDHLLRRNLAKKIFHPREPRPREPRRSSSHRIPRTLRHRPDLRPDQSR